MNLTALSAAIGLVATVGGGGVWFANELNAKATHEEVQVVGVQAEYALDKHLEYILSQINRLERKSHKTPDDVEQLRYLREELKRLREVRQGS